MINNKSPNILFVFTDQQRADALGAVNPVLRTPTVDRLAEEGTLFTQAYTPSPVCVAARCSLIFGQYAHNTGCFDNSFPMPAETKERPTFMSMLTEAGYQTHGVGKMHFTPDSQALRGFESRERCEEMAGPHEDDYCAWLHAGGYEYVQDTNGARGEMYYVPQLAQFPAEKHASAWVADRSLEFLKHRDRSRPFILWASFIDPHPPFAPPTPWHKLYRGPDMPLPKLPRDFENLWTYITRRQNRYKFRDAGIDLRLLQMMKAYYYATISFIDYNVGRIISRLEQTGELDNTLIIWTSDHGEFLGDYNCFGKRSFLRSAANIPLIARFPARFSAGRCVDTPVSLVDIFPTFLATCGIDAPSHLDGLDLAELAKDPHLREMIYGAYVFGGRDDFNTANYMAMNRRWKYIYSSSEDRQFLFDLQRDPDETRNRAEIPTCKAQTNVMRADLIARFRNDGFLIPLNGNTWRKFEPPIFPADPDAGLLFQDARWASTFIPGYTVT